MTHHLKIDEPHDIHISLTPAPHAGATAHPGATAPPDIRARLGLTGKIWAFTIVLLGACASTALGHGYAVFIAALAGAVVGTAAAWGAFGNRPAKAMPPSTQAIPSTKLKEIEERLANVETIVSYEEKIVEGKLRGLESRTLEPRTQVSASNGLTPSGLT